MGLFAAIAAAILHDAQQLVKVRKQKIWQVFQTTISLHSFRGKPVKRFN
jgi:hypothetical protein